jgi:hypothetical protein
VVSQKDLIALLVQPLNDLVEVQKCIQKKILIDVEEMLLQELHLVQMQVLALIKRLAIKNQIDPALLQEHVLKDQHRVM